MERMPWIGRVAPVSSDRVGASPIGLGFEKLDRAVFDPEKAYDKVAALGVKWIRIQSGWARTETAKGVYDFAWLDAVVDNLRHRGLVPWMCLCYGNGLYTEAATRVFGAVGCPPVATEEERAAWSRYVTALTRHFRGRVEWYEVWNEPDGKWCWKHGPDGAEYGEFVKATAAAAKAGDPGAKIMGGSTCLRDLGWLNDVFRTGAGKVMDALTYHGYSPDEVDNFDRVAALRALCRLYHPGMSLVQGETGTQSRSDGAGALRGAAWTPDRQARFLLRHMVSDLFHDVLFASYFSCVDMIEALNGVVGNQASWLDYGYFGVLAAEFDADGVATGEYRPKPSYRALQVLAALFRDGVVHEDLPVQHTCGLASPRLLRRDDEGKHLVQGGFRKPNGARAFAYWRATELLTTSYESTVSLEAAGLEGPARLVDPMDGNVYAVPPSMVEDNGRGHRRFLHLPLRDYPLLLTFGEFVDPMDTAKPEGKE